MNGRDIVIVGRDRRCCVVRKIFAIAFPGAVETNLPFTAARQSELVDVKVGVAKVSNHDDIITSTALLPAVVTNNGVVVILVKDRRVLSHEPRCVAVTVKP